MILSRLLRSSLKALGVVDSFSEPEAVQYEDALEALNSMLKSWASRGLVTYHVVTEQLSLVAGTSSYTIGTPGAFNTVRPNKVVGGYLRDSSNADSTLEIIARDDYNGIIVKNVSGRPCELYYRPSYPLGIIYFDAEPDQAYTLFLDSLKPLTALSVLDEDINLPTEYEEAIKWNLAVRLAPDYGVPPRADVVALAKSTYDDLSIQPVPQADFEGVPGNKGSRYNIESGF